MSLTDMAFSAKNAVATPTGRGTARARSRNATRHRLRTSAIELFAQRGVRATTTHAIAGAAGVASGTFYLHFKDKHELFREIILEALEGLRAMLVRVTADAPDPRSAVRRRAEALVEFAERNRQLIRLLFSHDTESAELQSYVLDTFAEFGEGQMRSQQSLGGFRADLDPAVAAQAVTGMAARVIDWWTKDPTRAARETIIETLTQVELSGTRPPAAHTATEAHPAETR
jgi:AcrR family transcriptional regulator